MTTLRVQLSYWDQNKLRRHSDTAAWGVLSSMDTTSDKHVTVVGVLDDNLRRKGMILLLQGEWDLNGPYGAQFRFRMATPEHPISKEETVHFLQVADNVGPVIARRMVDKHGLDAPRVLANTPEQLEEDGIMKGARLTAASDSIRAHLEEAGVARPLIELFRGIGFPRDLVKQVLSIGWNDPHARVTQNPFMLLTFRGVGWRKCDTLRVKVGLSRLDKDRLMHGLCFVVKEAGPSIWVDRAMVLVKARRTLGLTGEEEEEQILDVALENALANDWLRQRATTNHNGVETVWLAETVEAVTERRMARRLHDLSAAVPSKPWPPVPQGLLTEHQDEQIHKALDNGAVAWLYGGAGTGKTFTAAALIREALLTQHVVVCAPTGKAAIRVGQLLAELGLTLDTTTIHRLLGARPTSSGGFRFEVDGEHTFIAADLIVVDEASMLDNRLALNLLKAIRPGTKILFLGDPNQLPPVGPGRLLLDWAYWCELEPRYQIGKLEVPHRNEQKILEVCDSIRNGCDPELRHTTAPGVHWPAQDNLTFSECHTDLAARDKLVWFMRKVEAGVIPLANGTHATYADVQIITALNANTPLSRSVLNNGLVRMINPERTGGHAHFKAGDRVICMKNNWLTRFIVGGMSDEKEFIANGQIGYVTDSRQRSVVVAFEGSRSGVIVPTGEGEGDLALAYAITVHKSQGSEWPIVVVILDPSYGARNVMSRGWLYTALSRASDLCVVLGDSRTIRCAVMRPEAQHRRSFVCQILTELAQESTDATASQGR